MLGAAERKGRAVQGVPLPSALDSCQCTQILSGASAKKGEKMRLKNHLPFLTRFV